MEEATPNKAKKQAPKNKKNKKPDQDSDWKNTDSEGTNSDATTESESDSNSGKRKRIRKRRAKKKQTPNKKKQSPNNNKTTPNKKKTKKQKKKWTRCYADALPAIVEKNLSNAFNAKLDTATRGKAAMYPFCQRVLRVYLREWKKHGKSELHEERDKLVAEAVSVVQKHQVRPKDSGPFLGNDERAFKTIMCVLEAALVMPPGQAPAGSKVRHVLASTLQVYARFVRVRTCVVDTCVLALLIHAYLRC